VEEEVGWGGQGGLEGLIQAHHPSFIIIRSIIIRFNKTNWDIQATFCLLIIILFYFLNLKKIASKNLKP